jgi:hypothetical protein
VKKTFVIDEEGGVTAYPSRKEAEEAVTSNEGYGFDSLQTLEASLGNAPATMATTIWNSLPGVEPVKGFKSKSVAAARIWKRLQSLGEPEEATEAEAAEPVAKPKKAKRERKPKAEAKPRKSAKKAKSAKAPKKEKRVKREKSANGDSKKAQVIEMISKKGGATLDAIMEATGWQRHTTRGALSTLASKGGHKIESFKTEAGERAYRIA